MPPSNGRSRPGEGGSEKINRAAAGSAYIVRDATPRCDFCASSRPRWQFPCKPFTRSINGNPRLRYTSCGAWSACSPCRTLVEATRWADLRRRVIDRYTATHSPLTALQQAAQAEELTATWLQFHTNRTGPAEAVTA